MRVVDTGIDDMGVVVQIVDLDPSRWIGKAEVEDPIKK